MLKEITIQDVQELSGTFVFDRPLVIITGNNRTGKSALLNSIILDLIGFIPKLGQQPGRISRMSSGRSMAISSKHDGYELSQVWADKYAKTPVDHKFSSAELATLTPFFELTGAARSRFLLAKSGLEQQPSEVWDKIKGKLIEQKWKNSQLVVLQDLAPKEKTEFKVWIDTVIDLGKDRLKSAKSEVRGAEQVVKSATLMGATQTIEETPVSKEEEILLAEAELKGANTTVEGLAATAATDAANLRNNVTNGRRLKAELEQLELDQKKAPKCSRCGNDVACAHCETNATVENHAITAKGLAKKAAAAEWSVLKAKSDSSTSSLEAGKLLLVPIQEKLDGLRTLQNAFTASIGRKQVVSSAQTDLDALRVKADVLKDFVDSAVEVIREILDSGMVKTLERANRLITPVLGVTVEYKDNSFGYQRSTSGWVPLEVFSGIENMVFTAGMALALASATDEKILLIDELGIIVAPYKGKFLKTIRELIEQGVIAQFIGVDPTWNFKESEFIQVIRMADQPAAK